ncbi:MAG TPA: hypothetical protein VIU46_04510 [Gallionellaceae bacterium]
MQNDTSLYEIPADRMVYTHETLGAGRELGEAEIVNTLWGKAKVRVVNKPGKPGLGLVWLWVVLGIMAAIAAAWYLLAKPQTENTGPQQPVSPSTPVLQPLTESTSEQKLPDSNGGSVAQIPAPLPAAAAASTKAASPEPVISSTVDSSRKPPVEVKKPQVTAEKPQPATSRQHKPDSTETPVQAKPSGTAKPGSAQPHSAATANTATDSQKKLPERAGDPVNPPVANSTTSAKPDAPVIIPPVKVETIKSEASEPRQ